MAFVPWTGRRGWAGGGGGAQRMRSAVPAMGRSHGINMPGFAGRRSHSMELPQRRRLRPRLWSGPLVVHAATAPGRCRSPEASVPCKTRPLRGRPEISLHEISRRQGGADRQATNGAFVSWKRPFASPRLSFTAPPPRPRQQHLTRKTRSAQHSLRRLRSPGPRDKTPIQVRPG